METEKKMDGKYGNRYGIFTQKVDIKVLHDVIQEEVIPCITQNNLWFAVWCVLKDNKCLYMGVDRINFNRQMIDWYGNNYSSTCLNVYASTCLAERKWKEWANKDETAFPEFERVHGDAIARHRVSIRTVRKIYNLCKRFNPLIEQCIKQNN